MWMDVCIYSAKANCHAGNVRVYMVAKQKSQSHKILRKGSRKFTHFAGLFSRGPRVQERALLGTSVKLILKSIFPLEVVATILSGLRKGAFRA